MIVERFANRRPILSFIDRRLLKHLLPASVCVAALLALGMTPYFVCWLSGYGFVAPWQPFDMTYYLQLAAQPYYSHALYLSDPVSQGGATFYPWLQYIPFVCLTRWLGLSIFWIQILWTIAAEAGTALTLYVFLWLVFRNRWLAAGITICAWADIDLGLKWLAYRPLFVHQVYLVASDLIAHFRGQPLLARPMFPWQWRLTNPALDLPFIFLQLVATSVAREHPSRRNLALSGFAFAVTFYVYFYLWTMIAAGLCLAILVDRPGLRIYAWTLALGIALGWPQIAHDYLVKISFSVEGLKYFGLIASMPWNIGSKPPYFRLYLIIAELVILGVLVTRRKVTALILIWCMSCAGVCLSVVAVLIRIYMNLYVHEYHWAWLTVPVLHIMTVAVVLDLIMLWKPRWPVPGWVCAVLVSAYLVSGIYFVGSIHFIASQEYSRAITTYSEYNRQRFAPGVTPLRPDSVIAGDEYFVDFSAIAERQIPLRGMYLGNNMILGDEERRARYVLDKYLSGFDRDSFAVLLNEEGPMILPPGQLPGYSHAFDEVSRDPERSIDDLKVRYLALPAGQRAPTFLSRRWNLIQPGPYWQIWERIG
jgi:hypothetical protein